MKKFTLLRLFICASGIALAQANFSYGAKAGFNFTSLAGGNDDMVDYSTKIGYHFGALGRADITDKYGAQAEILFSRQGVKIADAESSGESGRKMAFSYLNMPLLFRYNLIPGLSLEAGPQLGFLLGAVRKWDSEDVPSPDVQFFVAPEKTRTSETGRFFEPVASTFGATHRVSGSGYESIIEYMKNVVLSFCIGVDYNLPYNLSANARYNLGLSKVYKNGDDRNSVFTLGVNYLFQL